MLHNWDSPPRSIRVERLFFALLPPKRLALSTTAWTQQMLEGSWNLQQPGRLHITIAITDDFDRLPLDLLDRLLRAGAMIRAAPFPVTLDQLAISRRSAALRPSRVNPGLKALQQAINHAMTVLGIPMRENWRFNPHMTLGYRDTTPWHQPVEPRTWRAEEFVLIHSLVGRTQHQLLGHWPLHPIRPAQYELF
ncbi:MAG TPA: 2'-5' RNA ligase family protein [Sphingobium sp.]|uniref:2'-5' RNA ligase family protein n=1 Tax=Sphingobium sp. TaxID=1912891 RepID=UPI002ED147C5